VTTYKYQVGPEYATYSVRVLFYAYSITAIMDHAGSSNNDRALQNCVDRVYANRVFIRLGILVLLLLLLLVFLLFFLESFAD
jgi:hypothetical protein